MFNVDFGKAFKYLGLAAPLLIGLAAAYAAGGLIALDGGPAPEVSVQSRAAREDSASRAGQEVILERNILALARAKPESGVRSASPSSAGAGGPRDWPLIGVIVGESESAAIVVVEGRAEILFPGQEVSGWTLVRIMPDKIQWDRNGEVLAVALSGEKAAIAEGAGKKGGAGPVAVVDPQKNKVRIDRDYARKIIENPSILLEQAQYKPYKHGSGMTIGFTIRGIDEGSVLKEVGIRNDDVLLRLNGKDLLGPSSLMQAYAGLKGSNIITMDILRNDKIESIMLELE